MLNIKGSIQRIAILTLVLASLSSIAQTTAEDKKVPAVNQGSGLTVTGTIKDGATGKPAPGVGIIVIGFSAAISDDQGSFTLKVPDYDALVQVTGEGFETRVVPLKGRKTIEVLLNDETHENMYQSVQMPNGTTMKSDITASVTGRETDGGWTSPMEIPDAFLQGKVAGLNSVRRSGTPGVGANMFLRGFTSLYATNKPLLVIDDMIYDYNDYGESIIANNYTNPLALIDVKDIQDVTVLKDASSIYGTKGANGVIIVTTSRAKQQATKIDFGAYYGVNFAPGKMPVMNASDYRIYLSDVLQARGWSSSDINSQPYMNDNTAGTDYYATHNNTDWQGKVMENSINSNYYIKVTGGDNIATYALSMGYMKNEGVVRGTDLSRYNTRFNANLNFTQKFTGTANLSFTYNEQNLKDLGIAPGTNPIYLGLVKSPLFTDREVNAEGKVSPNLADADMLGISNPKAVVDEMLAYNKYYRFYGSFGFKYKFNNNFAAGTLIGITYDKVRENVFIPRKGISNDTLSNAVIDSRMGTQVKRLYTLFTDTKLSYTKQSAVHGVNANIGFRYQNNSADQLYALGFNSATDELVSVQNGLNALRQVGGGVGEWSWINVYSNVDYHYKHKFFAGISAAFDASSRFGEQATEGLKLGDVPVAVMPAVNLAWLVSSEHFMANSGISLLKLRASASKSGNDDIGNYSARRTYRSQNLLGMQGLLRSGIGNPYLQWENVARLNFGVDLGLWNDRVQFTADLWSNKTTKMLTYKSVESIFGFDQVLTNDGEMKTNGVDLSLIVRAINKPKLKWDISANATTFKNEVLSIPGESFTTNYAGATLLTKEGQAASQFYGLTTNGVFASAAEAATSGLMRKAKDGSLVPFGGGDVIFNDLNGDKIIDINDRSVLGNAQPDWVGGINNKVMWDRFTFQALLTFTMGGQVYNYLRQQLESAGGVENQLQSVANRWRADGQVTNTPKATWGDPMGNAGFSDRWIEDGDYLRLRSLSVDYLVPLKNTRFIKDITVYAAGYNLLTFTNYLGFDPEFSANPSVFAQGIDTGLEPVYKSVMFGVKIGL